VRVENACSEKDKLPCPRNPIPALSMGARKTYGRRWPPNTQIAMVEALVTGSIGARLCEARLLARTDPRFGDARNELIGAPIEENGRFFFVLERPGSTA